MQDMNLVVGSHDLLLLVLDTLRFDVAERLHRAGRTPNLSRLLPPGGWERRQTTGAFTYPAHQAFFAGFLPVPEAPGAHPRPFALRFPGSETIAPTSCVLDGPDIVHGLAARGYRTLCIGGVGFFNKRSPLGEVLPGLFEESHWAPQLGVSEPRSTEHQLELARARLAALPRAKRVFLFLNISALHQPNYFYLPGATEDSVESHAAALEYVDRELPRLSAAMEARGTRWFGIICSDHGTCYGEGGYLGHRHPHPHVWTVPYAEFILRP
jgi:hypothetical protein